MASSKDTGRSLRVKARRHYNEGEHQDDEIEGKRTWNLEKKIKDEKFTTKWVKVMNGQDFTIKFLQEGGFDTPMLFKSTEGLGIKVPGKEFTVSDVKLHVGSRRQVDVMDVNTQKGVEMSMLQFAKYYENKEREELYNVISLEFSHTKLEEFVEAPSIVRQIDWVDIVWPQHLKKDQRDSTNTLAEMKYPKVQKYCLMSVAGCYTDFHVDFGGTSVWYHILHGKKIFWLIPPSEDNLELYENWVLSGKQADIFLGDRVRECTKIELEAGHTFMIPSGWIHAVYTPEDSLVFGGNILHSFHIHRQLRVAQIEDRTHVPFKFRYPFFWEMNWYALERYVHTLSGKTFLAKRKVEQETIPAPVDNSDEGTNDSLDVERGDKTDDIQDDVDIDGKIQIKKEENDLEASSPCSIAAESMTEVLGKSENVSIKDELVASPADTDKTEEMDFEDVARTLKEEYDEDTCREACDDKNGGSGGMLSNGDYHPDSTHIKVKSEPLDDHHDNNQDQATESENSFKQRVKSEPEDSEMHGNPEEDEGASVEGSGRPHVHLCRHELIGLRVLHHQLENLPLDKRSTPDLITDPDGLLQHAKEMLANHLEDSQALAVTGEPILKCPESTKTRAHKIPRHKLSCGMRHVSKRLTNGVRRRRTRCRKCDNCLSEDCRNCHFCKDMKKYGGPGRMKQSCVARQCLYPMLPHNAVCAICTREEQPGSSGAKTDAEICFLMECHECYEIVHPDCQAQQLDTEFEGVINEDLANSWECPKCVAKKETQGDDLDESSQNEKPVKRKKEEEDADVSQAKPRKGRPLLQKADIKPESLETEEGAPGEQDDHKDQLPTVLMKKRQPTVFPKFVVRPLPSTQPPQYFTVENGKNHPLPRHMWLMVFHLLPQSDLSRCLRVCKTWNKWCSGSVLWRTIDVSKTPLTSFVMAGIVRRQPISLNLNDSSITSQQLSWLIGRLPALKELYLARVSIATIVALCSSDCPQLRILDLQWVSLMDGHLNTLLSPIKDHRPGLVDDRTKLRKLRDLRLAGSDITDTSMEFLVEQTPLLTKLDLSFCSFLTDAGFKILLSKESVLIYSLKELNVSGCHQLTDASLTSISRCSTLMELKACLCPNLTYTKWKEWAVKSKVTLEM